MLFHCIDLFISCLLDKTKLSFGDIFQPSFALWYLLCLFYWRILTSFLVKYTRTLWIIPISLIVSVLIGFLPIYGHLGLHRFFSFYVYFILGFFYGNNIVKINYFKSLKEKNITLYIIVFILCFVLASFNPYWLDIIIYPYINIYGPILRLLYILNSIVLSYTFYVIISKIFHNDGILSKEGSNTLFYYLFHPYVLYVIIFVYIKLFDSSINIFVSLLICIIVTFILFKLRQIKVLNKILL